MKQIALFFVCFIYASSIFAEDKVTFKLRFSEPYAVYDFLGKISGSYPDNELKTTFQKSRYNTPQYKKMIADFEQLPIVYSYSYGQYPQVLKAAVMTSDLIEKNLVTSATITDFKRISTGIIPNEVLAPFSQTIEAFLPVYHELVAEPQKSKIETQENNLLAYINSNQFADYFQTGLDFYNTAWDKSIPFELNLLPSFDKGNLGARAFFNIAVCEASLDLKDHKTFFSVAIHEIYHIVYDNQSLEMKTNMQKWFNNTNSPNSQYALLLLNEVLATALGNAYVMERLNGKIEEDDWYGNQYISGMAKEIYPTVKKYIEEKKPIDEAFIQTYVQLYDSKFPNWTKELPHLFMYRYIVADSNSDWRYLRKAFRYASYSRLAAPLSATDVEKAKNTPITKVFVISENHQQKLDLLKNSFEEISSIKFKPKKEFITVVNLKDRTKLFIINRHASTVEQLMTRYYPNKKIE
jgi:hypothetical protein